MADPELASKLAKRLENVSDGPADVVRAQEAPRAPKIPEKVIRSHFTLHWGRAIFLFQVIPNPYVASDDSVSIDDLIAKTLERNERLEENNNVSFSYTLPRFYRCIPSYPAFASKLLLWCTTRSSWRHTFDDCKYFENCFLWKSSRLRDSSPKDEGFLGPTFYHS